MAMLAEPRRRKKYNLCPRGKALYEDTSRFGTKMLEKMGWSKGKGLGANLDGSQEFVRVRMKNDAEGLGYEMRDDQWTEHEEGFNGLLSALNGGNDENSNANDNGNASASEEETRPMGFGFKEENVEPVKGKTLKEKISGVSLEEKSKNSKARVHYRKFTRGKDLALYSEKDLANIFGKKSADDIDAPAAFIAPTEPEEEKEEEPINPNFAGVQTVSTGLSVSDYFKLKMEARKNKLLNGNEDSKPEPEQDTVVENMTEDSAPHKKKKKLKRAAEEDEPVRETVANENSAPKEKKKKKSKQVVEEENATEPVMETVLIENSAPKDKKKSNRAAEEEASNVQEVPLVDAASTEEADTKKKKKSKRATEEDTPGAAVVETVPLEESGSKEKKKKSKRATEENAITPSVETVSTEESTTKEKKKKSKRAVEEEKPEQPVEEIVVSEKSTTKEKKKKLRRAVAENGEEPATVETAPVEEPESKKKNNSKRAAELESEQSNQPKSKKKKKDKQATEEVKATNQIPASETTTKDAQQSTQINKKSKKSKQHVEDVSAESSSSEDAESNKYLSYEQLIELRDSYNICTISSFCAEKFHIFDMKAYKNSTLAQIPGYDVDENIQLNIVKAKNDDLRIVNLWDGKFSKYSRDNDDAAPRKKVKHKTAIRAVKKRQAFAGI